PVGLVRNVPLSLRPLRRSWIGTDSDEYPRIAPRGGVGAGGRGDIDAARGGHRDGGELPAGEAAAGVLSQERQCGAAPWERGSAVESRGGSGSAAAGARADSTEVWRG